MTATRMTLNIPLDGRLYVEKHWAVFGMDEAGDAEALVERIRTRSVESLSAIFEKFGQGVPDGLPLFLHANGWKCRSPTAAVIAERPDDYFAYVGGDWAGPSSEEIHVAPEVRLTLPDAYLYIAFEFAEDRAIKQNIVNLAENMIDAGWPLTRDLAGIQLPKGFMELRSRIEAEAMQNGVRGGSPSAVAASI